MATQGQRRRVAGSKKGGTPAPGSLPASLVAGMRGISEIAGNQALIATLARKRGSSQGLLDDTFDERALLEEKERVLAEHRLKLEQAEELIKKALGEREGRVPFGAVKAHLLALMQALDEALHLSEGYKGDLADEMEKVASTKDAGEHSTDALLEMLEALRRLGEGIHGKLADGLAGPAEKPLKVPPTMLSQLKEQMADIRRQAADPSKKADERKQAGMPKDPLDELFRRKKKFKGKRP